MLVTKCWNTAWTKSEHSKQSIHLPFDLGDQRNSPDAQQNHLQCSQGRRSCNRPRTCGMPHISCEPALSSSVTGTKGCVASKCQTKAVPGSAYGLNKTFGKNQSHLNQRTTNASYALTENVVMLILSLSGFKLQYRINYIYDFFTPW